MGEEWTKERIADLRLRATALRDAERQVTAESAALVHTGAWSAPLDDAISARDRAAAAVAEVLTGAGVLSLLDALEEARESERSKNAELQLASEALASAVTEIHDLRLQLETRNEAVCR